MKALDSRTLAAIALLVFSIAAAFFFILLPWLKADSLFVKSEYSGVIKAIEYKTGDRGIPDILIDSTWRSLTIDESKIKEHISVGDSIVKKEGRVIEIYEVQNGEYQLKGRY